MTTKTKRKGNNSNPSIHSLDETKGCPASGRQPPRKPLAKNVGEFFDMVHDVKGINLKKLERSKVFNLPGLNNLRHCHDSRINALDEKDSSPWLSWSLADKYYERTSIYRGSWQDSLRVRSGGYPYLQDVSGRASQRSLFALPCNEELLARPSKDDSLATKLLSELGFLDDDYSLVADSCSYTSPDIEDVVAAYDIEDEDNDVLNQLAQIKNLSTGIVGLRTLDLSRHGLGSRFFGPRFRNKQLLAKNSLLGATVLHPSTDNVSVSKAGSLANMMEQFIPARTRRITGLSFMGDVCSESVFGSYTNDYTPWLCMYPSAIGSCPERTIVASGMTCHPLNKVTISSALSRISEIIYVTPSYQRNHTHYSVHKLNHPSFATLGTTVRLLKRNNVLSKEVSVGLYDLLSGVNYLMSAFTALCNTFNMLHNLHTSLPRSGTQVSDVTSLVELVDRCFDYNVTSSAPTIFKTTQSFLMKKCPTIDQWRTAAVWVEKMVRALAIQSLKTSELLHGNNGINDYHHTRILRAFGITAPTRSYESAIRNVSPFVLIRSAFSHFNNDNVWHLLVSELGIGTMLHLAMTDPAALSCQVSKSSLESVSLADSDVLTALRL